MNIAQPLEALAARREALTPYSLDTLVTGAARLRPDGLAFADRLGPWPFGIVAAQVSALARILADCGLQPGERILIVGGAEVSVVTAAIAALRGGFRARVGADRSRRRGLSRLRAGDRRRRHRRADQLWRFRLV